MSPLLWGLALWVWTAVAVGAGWAMGAGTARGAAQTHPASELPEGFVPPSAALGSVRHAPEVRS